MTVRAEHRVRAAATRPTSTSSASASRTSRTRGRRSSRAASASASRSRARSRATRACSCSTSRSRRSTPTRRPTVRAELHELLARARDPDAPRHARLRGRGRARRPGRRARRRAASPDRLAGRARRAARRRVRRLVHRREPAARHAEPSADGSPRPARRRHGHHARRTPRRRSRARRLPVGHHRRRRSARRLGAERRRAAPIRTITELGNRARVTIGPVTAEITARVSRRASTCAGAGRLRVVQGDGNACRDPNRLVRLRSASHSVTSVSPALPSPAASAPWRTRGSQSCQRSPRAAAR